MQLRLNLFKLRKVHARTSCDADSVCIQPNKLKGQILLIMASKSAKSNK